MWVEEARLWWMERLGEHLADEDTDTKVYVLLEDPGISGDDRDFAFVDALDKAQIGTWASVFAGTLDSLPLGVGEIHLVAYYGHRQTYENETEDTQTVWGWAIQLEGIELCLIVRRFIAEQVIGPGQKFKFNPILRVGTSSAV